MWEWQAFLSLGTFLFTLAVFTFFIVRAIRMKKETSDRMGLLPVEDDSHPIDSNDHEHTL
jgi:hypothetical protein